MKDKITYLEMQNGKKYPMIFTLNVIEIIQEEYNTLEDWLQLVQGEKEPNIKALKFGLGAMINEGIDIANETSEEKQEELTSKQIGRIITELGIEEVAKKLGGNVVASTKTDNEEKNV